MRGVLAALLVAFLALPALAQQSDESPSRTSGADATPSSPVPDANDNMQLDLSTEHITGFDSDITVAKNGELTVTETISVISRGEQIIHGIYRDFPTRYSDKRGMAVHVRFDVVSVDRDGQREPYTTESIDNGIRVKMGDKNVDLTDGPHTYKLTYITNRQIGFFAKYDELYWNVTGNGWAFRIDEASATVHLPDGALILQDAFYTGSVGSTAQNAVARRLSPITIHVSTTQPLEPNEGLTIAVGFSKGAVAPPTEAELQREFIVDNASPIVALLGILSLTIFYFVTWWHHGRDPKRGTIIPLFAPPGNLSPESVRFIHKMAYDRKSFAAALVNMAVKGYLKIRDDAGTYTLERTAKSVVDSALSPGEIGIGTALFESGGYSAIELKQLNHSRIQGAITALKLALTTECEKHYFVTNGGWFVGGLAILALTGLASAVLSEDPGSAIFLSLWLSGWTAATSFLLHRVWINWTAVFSGPGSRIANFFAALFSTLFALPFSAGLVFGVIGFGKSMSFWAVVALIFGGLLAYIFYHLLKAPTVLGAATLDQIDGFKMFLETAEKDRLEMLNPPAVTPEVFEKFLPYAIALDCENRWSKKFEAQATAAGLGADQNYGYAPVWYVGSSLASLGTAQFVSSIGSSIGSAVATASTAPGSSSGSGGGGFSGGGGGGGGGGGW